MDTYDFTLDLIRQAGQLLEVKKKEKFSVMSKHDNPNDIVTSLDIELGEFITEKILATYPGHSIYSEEAKTIVGSGFEWTIDPIDGTASFARGIPQYAISIGLLQAGVPVLGAVLDPVANELFSFQKGMGAFLNNEPIKPSSHVDLSQCYVLLAAGRQAEQREWAGESLKKLLAKVNKTKNFGSSAIWLCYIAAGRVDGLAAGTFSPLDVAAAVGILNEAGGVITDAKGDPLKMDTAAVRTYAANNETICTQLRELLESE